MKLLLFLLFLWKNCVALPSSSSPSFINILNNADTSNIAACQAPNLISCKKITVNFELLRTSETLTFPGGVVMTKDGAATETDVYITERYRGSEGGSTARLTTMKDPSKHYLIGSVRDEHGRIFNIENCGENCEVWLEANRPPEATLSARNGLSNPVEYVPTERDLALLAEGREDRQTIVTYSVMVYYTQQFAAITSDIAGYLAAVIAETNLGYKNSKIPIQVKLFCAEKATGLAEVYSSSTMLSNFRNWKGGNIPALLRTADVTMLLTSDSDSCGIAYTNSPSLTVGMAVKSCALGYFSFGHEIAHMFGAQHNRETGATGSYPYGYGYLIQPRGLSPSTGYRTILAYPANYNSIRVNYYSSSDTSVRFSNLATGNSVTDNARVITERRNLYVNIGNESGTCGGIAG